MPFIATTTNPINLAINQDVIRGIVETVEQDIRRLVAGEFNTKEVGPLTTEQEKTAYKMQEEIIETVLTALDDDFLITEF